jgi:protein TonB
VAPAYPDALRRAGVEGEVLVTFVVDTLGLADLSTFAVIRSTHTLFTQAVRAAIGRQRFTPATIGTRTVRQLVQQPYSFAIRP